MHPKWDKGSAVPAGGTLFAGTAQRETGRFTVLCATFRLIWCHAIYSFTTCWSLPTKVQSVGHLKSWDVSACCRLWLFHCSQVRCARRCDTIFVSGFCGTNFRGDWRWDASNCCLWGGSRLKQRKSEFSRRMARNCGMFRKHGRPPICFFPVLFRRLRGSLRFLWTYMSPLDSIHELSDRIRQILASIACCS